MDKAMIIELIGYLGSGLVLVSMLMTSVIKLRIINMIGSVVFSAYAFIIQSYPTAFMNTALVIINIYNLVKLLKTNKEYDLIKVNTEDSFVDYFLNYYKKDIAEFFPDFEKNEGYNMGYVVFCNTKPAGVMLGTQNGEEVKIALDYTTPFYRDCSVGKYLHGEITKTKVKKLVFENPSEKHVGYLLKMGYKEESNVYTKEL